MKYLFLFILLLAIPTKAQIINNLPCEDSSATCVETLTALAWENSQSIKLLDETIKLAKRRGWTNYIDVSALNPVILSLQLIRNALGGGERQKRKIEIKTLELARADKAAHLRAEISALLFALDFLDKRITAQKIAQDAHSKRVSLYEISYAYGDGNTETMLSLWQTSDAIKNTLDLLLADKEETRRKLIEIITPHSAAKTKDEARAAVPEQVLAAWKLSSPHLLSQSDGEFFVVFHS